MTDQAVALVDTNILFDVLFDDPVWTNWSMRQLDAASLRGPLAINDVVYAELSVRFPTIELLDQTISKVGVQVLATPRPALFMAAKAFQQYRARGGARTSILPDFFIGAQAAALGLPLITRDVRRYRTYFPRLELITP